MMEFSKRYQAVKFLADKLPGEELSVDNDGQLCVWAEGEKLPSGLQMLPIEGNKLGRTLLVHIGPKALS